MVVLKAAIKVQILSFYRTRGDGWMTSDWRRTMNSAAPVIRVGAQAHRGAPS